MCIQNTAQIAEATCIQRLATESETKKPEEADSEVPYAQKKHPGNLTTARMNHNPIINN